jgi:hypothetical protein
MESHVSLEIEQGHAVDSAVESAGEGQSKRCASEPLLEMLLIQPGSVSDGWWKSDIRRSTGSIGCQTE